MTNTPISIIFQPCFKKVLIWSLIEAPAYAPTIVRGAVKLIFPADAMTNSRHGEIGDAASSPIIETYATIGNFKGTTLLTATPAIAIASRMHVPGRESVNAT